MSSATNTDDHIRQTGTFRIGDKEIVAHRVSKRHSVFQRKHPAFSVANGAELWGILRSYPGDEVYLYQEMGNYFHALPYPEGTEYYALKAAEVENFLSYIEAEAVAVDFDWRTEGF